MKYLIFALSQRQTADSAQGTANSRRSVSDYNSWQPANVGRQSSCRFANWPSRQIAKCNYFSFTAIKCSEELVWLGRRSSRRALLARIPRIFGSATARLTASHAAYSKYNQSRNWPIAPMSVMTLMVAKLPSYCLNVD